MQTQFVLAAAICLALPCAAQQGNLSDWPKLIKNNDADAARKLCAPFESSKVLTEQVEAEKCMSNVVLMGANAVRTEKDKNGQFVMFDEWIPAAVDESLEHLNRGIRLAPQDLSIHQGRLHVLEIARRYDQMPKALDESVTLYKGPGTPDAWIAYSAELMNLGQYEAGLKLTKVLDAHYPDNPDILGNMGAFLSMLKRDQEAIEALKRAADLAPKDSINAWDLGREYDFAGQVALADEWYRKALPLMTDEDQRKHSLCLYGEFIEKKLNDRARACRLEKENCEADGQTACTLSTPAKNQ